MPTRSRPDPIDIPGLDVPGAKRYSRVRLAMTALSTGLTLARALWLLDRRRSRRLTTAAAAWAPAPPLRPLAAIAALTGVNWLSSLPLAYAGDYLVERHFSLTKQSPAGWLADAGKGLVLSLALQVPLTAGGFAVVRRRPDDWWLVLAGVVVPLSVVAGNLAPILIMPLFNRFEPLADAELTARLRALANRAGVTIADIYQVDMSRQTEKPNAFFTGIGATKRIVLGDTLLARLDPAGIEGVVAHELGHQVHGDMWRMVALSGAAGFATAFALHRLLPPLLTRLAPRSGVTEPGDEAALPAYTVALTGISLVIMPMVAAVSRAIERRTDQYALHLTGDGAAYARAMEMLAASSLADPSPPRLVVWLLASHPPIADRIRAARAFAAAMGAP